MITKASLTTSMGYAKFGTATEARRFAEKMGIGGSHSHVMDGQRIHMPGRNHRVLNDALRERGLPTTMVPGQGSSGMDGSGSSQGMTGMGMGDDMAMSNGMSGESVGPDVGLNVALDDMKTDVDDMKMGESPRNEMGGEMSMSKADDNAMAAGMFDFDIDAEVETPADPMNLGRMGVDNAIDAATDDDPDNEVELTVDGNSVGLDLNSVEPEGMTSSHNDDDDDDDRNGGIYS